MQQCSKSIQPCCGRKLRQQALTGELKSMSSGKHWGCILTSSHLAFTMCRYTHLFKETEIHTGADAQLPTCSERTPTALQVLIYIQLEMSIYSSFNLSLSILIPMCLCVSKCDLSFLCLIWCFTASDLFVPV